MRCPQSPEDRSESCPKLPDMKARDFKLNLLLMLTVGNLTLNGIGTVAGLEAGTGAGFIPVAGLVVGMVLSLGIMCSFMRGGDQDGP